MNWFNALFHKFYTWKVSFPHEVIEHALCVSCGSLKRFPHTFTTHSHIGWGKSMPFASINPSNPRTYPWNFHKKFLRIGNFEKCTFFELAILNFLCLILTKTRQSLLVNKGFSKFWWLLWFPAKNHPHLLLFDNTRWNDRPNKKKEWMNNN